MPSSQSNSKVLQLNKRNKGLMILGIITLGYALLFFNGISILRIFPPCFFHKATGLYCPGCGATRGTWHLLHGDVMKALDSNALLPLILGLIGYELTRTLAMMLFAKQLPAIQVPRPLLYVMIGIVLLFAVARNLPYQPFAWLAP